MKRNTSIWKGRVVAGALLIGLMSSASGQISYPYILPGQQNATLNVNTGNVTPFNHMLLGLNMNWPENLYGIDGFNDSDAQSLITSWGPSSLRFPHGVWANFYDWEVDGRRIYDGYTGTYYNAVVNVPNLRYGFPGLDTLRSNLDFVVLFTWNINYDSPAKGVARLQDRQARGFDVKWIELGNETFWMDQRSEAVDTPAKYVAVAQAHSAAIRAEDPTVQISVPVTWRTGGVHTPWNAALMADMSYYDAVTLHKYNTPSGNSEADVKDALNARNVMLESGQYIRSLFPGKPIWVSEWGVSCDDGENGASVLGMAETFMCFLDHPDLFETADYFQMNAKDPMISYDKTTHTHTKTSFGAAYDVIREIFEGSDVYGSSLNVSSIEEDLDAITAHAVTRGGDVLVFAINKTTNSIPFDVKFDDALYAGSFTHEAFSFSDVNDFPSFGLLESPLVSVPPHNGDILLPPLSLSRISGLAIGGTSVESGEVIIEAESAVLQADFSPYTVESEADGTTYIITSNGTPTVNFNSVSQPSGKSTYPFTLSQAGDLLVEARINLVDSNTDSFWHRIDGGTWIKQDGFSGGGWRWFTLNPYTNLAGGTHILEIARRDRAQIDQFRLSSTFARISTPGLQVEAEDAEGQPAFSPFAVAADADGTTYVDVPLGIGSVNYNAVNEPDGLAIYDFTLTDFADITLEARVDFPSSGNDSFWHRIDGGSWTVQDGISGGGWRWLTMKQYMGLAAGPHVLEIARRQEGSRIDGFRLVPSAGGFVLPNTVARAGGNQSVVDTDADGIELISLNGSDSTPGDGLTITNYTWKRASRQLATGASPTVMMPLGVHILTLLVSDSSGSTSSDDVVITVEPAPSSSGATTNIVAGWEVWNTGGTLSASTSTGVTAIATKSGWSIEFRASSSDGTFGTFAGADTTIGTNSATHLYGTRLRNGVEGFMDLTLTDTSGNATALSGFHFDAASRSPSSVTNWQLEVLSGGALTAGVVESGPVPVQNNPANALPDVDVSLAGLTDVSLDAFATVTFRLSVSGSSGTGHFDMDNVGISGSVASGDAAYPDQDGNGLPDYWEILYLGGTGQVATADSDGDGQSHLDEYVAGTLPNDGDSRFEFNRFEVNVAGDATFKWDSYSGRTYHILKSSSLTTTGSWSSVSGDVFGTGGELSFTDAVGTETNGYYRTKVHMP
nr:hypothetical protein [uncultured bacterium]